MKAFSNWMLHGAAALAGGLMTALALPGLAAAQTPQSVIDAAKAEGHLVYFSANLPDVEQPVIAAFHARYPFIEVEFVRIPNAQLIPRVQAEASTGRLTADVVETTDTSDARRMEALFTDYAPPNAAAFPADSQDSKKFWPVCALPYVISINTAVVKKEPKSLKDLLDPVYKERIGLVVPSAGGTPFAMSLMERLVMGDDYWKQLAAQKPSLYLSSVPLMTAVASGEAFIGLVPLVAVTPLQKQGAPVKAIAIEEGIPAIPVASGIVKGGKNPNAARLFLDWSLSAEGQQAYVTQGCASADPSAKLPAGLEGSTAKVWIPPMAKYASQQADMVKEWNKIYNYNQ